MESISIFNRSRMRVNFGRSGLSVSPLCFGTWQLSPRFWGPQPEDQIIAAMRRAYEVGVNFYDTADAYGEGYAEEVVAKALKPFARSELVVATKLYWHWDEKKERLPDLRPEYVLKACEASLKRLKMDYIDLYQCHSWDPLVELTATVDALESLQSAGKIRAYGVSNWSVEQMRTAIAAGARIVSAQPPYSLLERDIEKDLLPFCQSAQLAVMTYNSLHRGLLTGKFKGDEAFTDLRREQKDFCGERFRDLSHKVASLKPLAESYGLTVTQLVLAVTLRHPAVTAAIVGIKNPGQIEEAAGALDRRISHEDAHRVRNLLA